MLAIFDFALVVLVWLLSFLVLLVVALGSVIGSLKHRRHPHFRIKTDAPLPDLLPSATGLMHGQLIDGNSVGIVDARGSKDMGSRTRRQLEDAGRRPFKPGDDLR